MAQQIDHDNLTVICKCGYQMEHTGVITGHGVGFKCVCPVCGKDCVNLEGCGGCQNIMEQEDPDEDMCPNGCSLVISEVVPVSTETGHDYDIMFEHCPVCGFIAEIYPIDMEDVPQEE